MDGRAERRQVWPEEIRDWLLGARWALGGGWALGEGFHGAPLVLIEPEGGKDRRIGPMVRLEDLERLRLRAQELRRRRNFRRVLPLVVLLALVGLLALARRKSSLPSKRFSSDAGSHPVLWPQKQVLRNLCVSLTKAYRK